MELARTMESWRSPPRVSIVAVYAGVGKADAAFHLLDRAAETPSTTLVRLFQALAQLNLCSICVPLIVTPTPRPVLALRILFVAE